MSQEVQNGLALLHGIRNDGTPITIEGYASFIVDSMKGQHKFKLDAIEDEIGFDRSLIATNPYTELDIAWTPAGATRAAAEATVAFLEPLAKVTIAHCAVDTFNGDYVYVGDQSIDLSHKQGKMSFKIRQYADEDQNASLTTTVSS
jgi:hypothetical protein